MNTIDSRFYRSKIKCSDRLSGFYKYSDIFQIYGDNYNTFFIEYNSKYVNNNAEYLNSIIADNPLSKNNIKNRVHLQLLKELVAILSLTTNEYFQIERDESQYLPENQENIPCFSEIKEDRQIIKDKIFFEKTSKFNDESIKIHPEVDVFLEKYFGLNPEDREKYNSSLFLYKIGQDSLAISASISMLAYISSIENLMDFEVERNKTENEVCPACNQKKFRISARFKEFMGKFSFMKEKKILDKIYTNRSQITHAGALLSLDKDIILYADKKIQEIFDIQFYVRSALFNYMIDI